MTARRGRRSPDPPGTAELVTRHLGAGDPTGWFEPVYAAAAGDPAGVPWAALAPHPYLEDWLAAPVARPPGTRAVVVGAGLGDDAALLARHGYAVTAVDISSTAMTWAARRFADLDVDWQVIDLLDDDARAALEGRFDLVVEVLTVGWLPGVVRDAMMHAIGTLAAPRGVVVAVSAVATDAEVVAGWDGPPWLQAPSELATYRSPGLVRLAVDHGPPEDDGALVVRTTWQLPPGQPPPRLGGEGGLPIV